MESNVLNKLKDTELKMLEEIDKMCMRNNIKYFIMYGTLLGGLRHKGFIPWDDDIDIAMPREDFERFIKIADNELNGIYRLDYFTTNKKYYLPFAKVRNIKTIFAEKTLVNYNGEKGIFIDIFPFDDIEVSSYNKKCFHKQKKLNVLYNIMIYKSLRLDCPFYIRMLSHLFSNVTIWKIIKKISHGKEGNYLNFYSPFGKRYCKIYDKKDVFPLKRISFDRLKVNAPNNSKKILSELYGDDYMTLPPVEERTTHNPMYIQFEDGKVYNFEDE